MSPFKQRLMPGDCGAPRSNFPLGARWRRLAARLDATRNLHHGLLRPGLQLVILAEAPAQIAVGVLVVDYTLRLVVPSEPPARSIGDIRQETRFGDAMAV